MLSVLKLTIFCCVILQIQGDSDGEILKHTECPLVRCMRPCKCGYVVDSNGCQTCGCIVPKDKKCRKKCPIANCPTIKCTYGLAVDKCNCTICQCNTVCTGVSCEDQFYCEILGTIPTCVPCPVHDCPIDTYCPNGFEKDESGCYTCRCVECGSG